MKNIQLIVFLMAALIMASGCKKDFDNPNNTKVDDALSTPQGLSAIATGLQRNFSTTRAGTLYNVVTGNGFSTYELSNRNTGNVDETNLDIGNTAVDGSNNVIGNLWSTSLKVVYDATRVINAAKELGDKQYASGLIGFATIYKALSEGSMAVFWEQLPDTTGVGVTVNFIPRQQRFERIIADLDYAISVIATDPPSPFVLNSLPPGVNIPNTLQALKARYALFAGQYDVALAAANAVDLTMKSEIRFDALNPNPIFQVSTSTNNVFQVIDSTFGLPVDLRPTYPNDQRINFYMVINTGAAPRWRISGFGKELTTPWPIYVPGEIMLIKAECHIRKTGGPAIPDAIVAINQVRTKTPATDPYGIGASETPYAGSVNEQAILTEIYRQRAIELYMQGLKMEDMRRFNRSNTPMEEKKRNFFPYPFRERDNNSATPDDPAF
jgi:hypothetical protein